MNFIIKWHWKFNQSYKVKDMNYEIGISISSWSIYELLKDLRSLEDEYIIWWRTKKQATMDAVQNFANENLGTFKKWR